MMERAVVYFQRGIRMWKRDKIVEIRRFGSSKDFVGKRKYLIDYSFFNFEPV